MKLTICDDFEFITAKELRLFVRLISAGTSMKRNLEIIGTLTTLPSTSIADVISLIFHVISTYDDGNSYATLQIVANSKV